MKVSGGFKNLPSKGSRILPVVGMMMVAHDRDSSDCRFLMPATSTHNGPMVCV